MALFCGARARKRQGRRILTTRVEHPAVRESCKALAAEGFTTVFAETDGDGVVIPASVEAALTDDTILLSCMHVNNETGAVQPIGALLDVKAAFEKRTGKALLFHVDAVQSFCKVPLSRDEAGGDVASGVSTGADGGRRAPSALPAGIDLLSLSAHKIHGPKGAGALYVAQGLHLAPLLPGGGQEGGLRSGTENVPGIAGFGAAAAQAFAEWEERQARVRACRAALLEGLLAEVRDIRVNGPGAATGRVSPFILNVSFLGVRGEVQLRDLERQGVLVSAGSACSSRKKERSHVLAAMGLSEQESEGAIRFSLGDGNTLEEMAYVVEAVKGAVARFRALKRFR
jgi:cysteine desulfurase